MRVGITGHRGLNTHVEAQVRALLTDQIQAYDPTDLVGVSCIADGPDSWFAETVLKYGGRLEVVVPAAEYREGLPDWHHPVYDRLISRAADIHHTGIPSRPPKPIRQGPRSSSAWSTSWSRYGTGNRPGDTGARRTWWPTPNGPASP